MIIYIILIIEQVLSQWSIPITYTSLCSCSQITDDQLCRASQFCELDLDYKCIEILDYNCSYFNEQTVQYLCSKLDRCYLNNQTCTELTNCSELTGQSNEECFQQSNRCGTVSSQNVCQLTQCQSYKTDYDCNDSLMNIRFDNIGYGEVCYWNNQAQICQSLLCENVSNQLCSQYNNLCVLVNDLCTWATCSNLSSDQCTYVWVNSFRNEIIPCVLKEGMCQNANDPSDFQNNDCTTNTLYTYILEDENICTQCKNQLKLILQVILIILLL